MKKLWPYISSISISILFVAAMIGLLYAKLEYFSAWPIGPSEELIEKAQNELNILDLEQFYLLSLETNNRSIVRLLKIKGSGSLIGESTTPTP